MSVDISKAVRLMKAVELKSVRLIEAQMKSNLAPGEEIAEVAADFNFGGGAIPQSVGDAL